ncbi:hypothetical protein ACMAZD_07200 [Vibrio sp. nBUS_14]|uniref:hypothetical protein n=1 Tax=Vibrio sp. nBUS_14 TaxID=3395321 RepID=UPI003EC01890
MHFLVTEIEMEGHKLGRNRVFRSLTGRQTCLSPAFLITAFSLLTPILVSAQTVLVWVFFWGLKYSMPIRKGSLMHGSQLYADFVVYIGKLSSSQSAKGFVA